MGHHRARRDARYAIDRFLDGLAPRIEDSRRDPESTD
jgi:hypothetical protein